MSYFSSTQPSSVSNPARQLNEQLANTPAGAQGQVGPPVNGAGSLGGGDWYYASTNLTTDIVAANFFSDGYALGMRPGDMVRGCEYTSLGSSVITFMGTVTSVTTSGASLSTGSLMTSTFN